MASEYPRDPYLNQAPACSTQYPTRYHNVILDLPTEIACVFPGMFEGLGSRLEGQITLENTFWDGAFLNTSTNDEGSALEN